MEWFAFVVGLVIGAATGFAGGMYAQFVRHRRGSGMSRRIATHFHPVPIGDLAISERQFPVRVRADLQQAVDSLLHDGRTVALFCGIESMYGMGTARFATLLADQHAMCYAVPPEYEEVDVGEQQSVRCVKNGLWLLEEGSRKYAVLMAVNTEHGPCGLISHLVFQVATAGDPEDVHFAEQFFETLEKSVSQGKSYRGKVLSLESANEYSGKSTGINVHKLPGVDRGEVILPRETLELLDRNVLGFVDRRSRLAEFGLATKKGLLFYGPPGTGKTHTVHYLAGAMKGHTTLLITAEQVGLLAEYMTLARLLQPSMVVVEDVDLIAKERTEMEVTQLVLLHKLLNEMDGLKEDADILFVLTTNRPESLETALSSRPGRIDQAIEFPLPDEPGREKLARLYARGADVSDEVVRAIVQKTDQVSAAFIKELMRRSIQFHLERSDSQSIELQDVNAALEEMLFRGGSLNLKLLGAKIESQE